MRALFLAHDPGSRPGMVGDALARRGFDVEVLAMARAIDDGAWNGRFPPVDAADLLVPLGAIFSLNDRSQVGGWIDAELKLLRDADRQGVPVLGICFGGQALAAAHAGEVVPAETAQIGWSTVETDAPSLVPSGPWMQWHTDRFVVPPAATELARDASCSQAFVLRRNLGVQFHPEVDEAGIAHWLELAGPDGEAAAHAAGTSAEQLLADARANAEQASRGVETLVDAFLTEVAGLA